MVYSALPAPIQIMCGRTPILENRVEFVKLFKTPDRSPVRGVAVMEDPRSGGPALWAGFHDSGYFRIVGKLVRYEDVKNWVDFGALPPHLPDDQPADERIAPLLKAVLAARQIDYVPLLLSALVSESPSVLDRAIAFLQSEEEER
ncbi:MAG: hypothetical protein QXT58_04600 [Archaeoglobaceae archaeon]